VGQVSTVTIPLVGPVNHPSLVALFEQQAPQTVARLDSQRLSRLTILPCFRGVDANESYFPVVRQHQGVAIVNVANLDWLCGGWPRAAASQRCLLPAEQHKKGANPGRLS
jgi:hypothetical protein